MRKMFKYHMLLLLALGLFTGVCAQRTGISASFGGATFAMDDMKYLQESILESYPVEGAIISSFPPYLTGSAQLLHEFQSYLRAGLAYTFTSTGGRSDYTDYSGNLYTDFLASSHRLGVSVNYTILGNERLDLSLYGKLDANLTHIEITSSIDVQGLTSGVLNNYKSISPNISAGMEFLYKFKDSAFGIEGGYLIDTGGNLVNRDSGTDLLDPSDSDKILVSDWSGWRLGIKGILWIN